MISGDLFQIILDIFGKQDAKHAHIIAYAGFCVNALFETPRNTMPALRQPDFTSCERAASRAISDISINNLVKAQLFLTGRGLRRKLGRFYSTGSATTGRAHVQNKAKGLQSRDCP
jgi:hypothetical protein